MKRIAIISADENEFFARGKRLAALADAGKPIPSVSVISFGDPAVLLNAGHGMMKRMSLVAQKMRL